MDALARALRASRGRTEGGAADGAAPPAARSRRRRAPRARAAACRRRPSATASAATRSPRTRVCALCRSPKRDPTLLCVVETPADLHDGRADAGVFRSLLRADGTALAARRHRPEGNPARSAAQARDRRRGARGDPRDQLHQRRRGDGPLHRRTADGARARRSAGSRAAFRWGASSSTSTAARWRRRCASGGRSALTPRGREYRDPPAGALCRRAEVMDFPEAAGIDFQDNERGGPPQSGDRTISRDSGATNARFPYAAQRRHFNGGRMTRKPTVPALPNAATTAASPPQVPEGRHRRRRRAARRSASR